MEAPTKLLGNEWLFGSITVGFWTLWAVLFGAMMALQRKEMLRIRAGDPEFSE